MSFKKAQRSSIRWRRRRVSVDDVNLLEEERVGPRGSLRLNGAGTPVMIDTPCRGSRGRDEL
jgi:hypothetical protein